MYDFELCLAIPVSVDGETEDRDVVICGSHREPVLDDGSSVVAEEIIIHTVTDIEAEYDYDDSDYDTYYVIELVRKVLET